jgi:hypothetical protein
VNLDNYYNTKTILFWLKDPTPVYTTPSGSLVTRCKIFSVPEGTVSNKGLGIKGLLEEGRDDEIELYATEWLKDVVTLPDGFVLVSVFLKADGMWYFNVSHPSYLPGIDEPQPLFEYSYKLPDKLTPTGMSSLDELPED